MPVVSACRCRLGPPNLGRVIDYDNVCALLPDLGRLLAKGTRKRLSKKSQKNIDAIFPKLAGKLIGTSDHDEVVIDPELKEDPEFDIEELEKKVKLDPDGTLAAIAAIHKAKKAKINTDDKDKIVIEPIDKKSTTGESYKISNSNLIYENSLLKVLFSDD